MEIISLNNNFHKRKFRQKKSLSEFLHDLKKLWSAVIPNLNASVTNKLLLHQLLVGLPSCVCKQFHAVGNTIDLDRVLEWACLSVTMADQPE